MITKMLRHNIRIIIAIINNPYPGRTQIWIIIVSLYRSLLQKTMSKQNQNWKTAAPYAGSGYAIE